MFQQIQSRKEDLNNMFYENENENFAILYDFVCKNPQCLLDVVMDNGDAFQAEYDTDYDSDNGLEIGEKGYEEYHTILLHRLDTGEYVEVTYKNFPCKIMSGGNVIYQKSE